MSNVKRNIDALESRIGVMAALAKIIDIDMSRNGNEGEEPILTPYHYSSLIEAIDVVADSCYEQLGQLDEKVKQGGEL